MLLFVNQRGLPTRKKRVQSPSRQCPMITYHNTDARGSVALYVELGFA